MLFDILKNDNRSINGKVMKKGNISDSGIKKPIVE